MKYLIIRVIYCPLPQVVDLIIYLVSGLLDVCVYSRAGQVKGWGLEGECIRAIRMGQLRLSL